MSDQLKNFKEYIGKLKGVVGEEGANKTISNSLFLLSAGNNDIAVIYLDTPSRAFQYDVPTYTSLLVSWTSTFIKVRIMLLYILLFASTYWIQHFTLYSTLKRQYLPRFSLHYNCSAFRVKKLIFSVIYYTNFFEGFIWTRSTKNWCFEYIATGLFTDNKNSTWGANEVLWR